LLDLISCNDRKNRGRVVIAFWKNGSRHDHWLELDNRYLLGRYAISRKKQ
jgi:hypothetical protein